MLTNLSIRDVILIDRLDLEFASGLTVLTGETGAGKSIVLDSLSLALGARSEKGLVRSGSRVGSVSLRFEPPAGHPVLAKLDEQGLGADDEVVLRRVIQPDGRSRAFVNGEAVSVSLLRELGKHLIEVHGQMDQHGLTDTKSHTAILDTVGGHRAELASVEAASSSWKSAGRELDDFEAGIQRARQEFDYLSHRFGELDTLDVTVGEESALLAQRLELQNREKLVELVDEVIEGLDGDGAFSSRLGALQRKIERSPPHLRERLARTADALDRALIEAVEASSAAAEIQAELQFADSNLEAIESRLFSIRDAARKYGVGPDQLPELRERTKAALDALESNDHKLVQLRETVDAAMSAYGRAAAGLRKRRKLTAKSLTQDISAEFAPLKLDRARFRIRFDERQLDSADAAGSERAIFEISTNPGQGFGTLGKIASGGELSRLMLALKVVLANTQTTHSMVFDEVDSGVGGATAAAVGDRLARLAEHQQVLVVTHAPQVAARAHQHYTVVKRSDRNQTHVDVRPLAPEERLDEIARMLSGVEVSAEALAAAGKLMQAESV